MSLKAKLENRTATISVLGLGYVGLPLAVEFAKVGFPVIGIDVDENRLHTIKTGALVSSDVDANTLSRLVSNGSFILTSSYAAIEQCDVIIICVPTPLSKTKEPDISCILTAAKGILKFLQKGQLIVLESTTFPGTTEEIFLPGIEAKGLRVGQDIYLAYSPERINPGNRDFPLRQIPKVIGAISETCLEMVSALYATVIHKVVPVSSTRAAEMVKLLENTFRVVNIALVNEVALMCDRLGLDVWEIIEAAATKPFGFMPFTPGPGLGGHCVPVDPQYLAWKLKTLNYTARFIGLASDVNAHMPSYVTTKVTDALNAEEKAVKGSTILILGVTYKRDVADCRESPALDIMRLLRVKGALVQYHDPHIPCLDLDGELVTSVELTSSCLREADCMIIVTDHSAYDWQWIVQNARLIVDTRNATRSVQLSGARIIKL